jgi:hypothetical protein
MAAQAPFSIGDKGRAFRGTGLAPTKEACSIWPHHTLSPTQPWMPHVPIRTLLDRHKTNELSPR